MRTAPQTCYTLLETLLLERARARADGRAVDAARCSRLWSAGGGAAADAAAVCEARDPAAALTTRLLAEGVLSPGELAHLHQRVHAAAG